MAASLAADTAVRRLDTGLFEATITNHWGVGRGAHGGYQAAIILRALLEAQTADRRIPLTLNVHFLRPAGVGPMFVEVVAERLGSSIAVWRVSLTQKSRPVAVALASFTNRFTQLDFQDMVQPEVPQPEQCAPIVSRKDHPSYLDNWELRPCLGEPPFSGGKRAETGGWLRLIDPEPIDVCTVTAMTDAWIPALFVTRQRPAILPTLDLTIHFRNLPTSKWEFCFCHFHSSVSRGGYVEEDGEIWSRSGELLAQSRQLLFLLQSSPDSIRPSGPR